MLTTKEYLRLPEKKQQEYDKSISEQYPSGSLVCIPGGTGAVSYRIYRVVQHFSPNSRLVKYSSLGKKKFRQNKRMESQLEIAFELNFDVSSKRRNKVVMPTHMLHPVDILILGRAHQTLLDMMGNVCKK